MTFSNPNFKKLRLFLSVITCLLLCNFSQIFSASSGEEIWTYDSELQIEHVETADLNGDNIVDIIAAEYSSSYYGELSKVYAINGIDGDTLWSYQLDDGARSMTVADLNNDGIVDVIIGCSYHSTNTPDGRVHAIDGSDGSQLWTFNIGATITTVTTGNFNGDPFLDVAAGSFDDFIYAINGQTGTQLWNHEVSSLWINDVSSGDVNGDNIDDVAYAHEYLTNFDNFCGVLDGTNGIPIWEDTVTYVVMTSLMADIDDDGDLEVIYGGIYADDHAELYVRNGLTGEIEWSSNLGPMNHTNGDIILLTHDIDEDNDLDLLVSRYLGAYNILAFNGDSDVLMWTSDLLNGYADDMAVGDVTGDGSLNIIAAAGDRVHVLDASGGKNKYYYSVNGSIESVAIGDFDNNDTLDITAGGGADFVGTPPDPGKGVWAIKTTTSPLLWEYDFGEYGNALTVVDLNDDNYDDVIGICSLDDKVWVISGQTGDTLWTWTGTENLYAITHGDFNNDNQIDIAVAGNDDLVTAIDGGSGLVLWQYTLLGNQVYRKCLHAADLNNDGNIDVIAGADDSKVHAIRGENGAQLWEQPVGGAVGEIRLAQMDSSGVIDIVVGVSGAGDKVVILKGEDGSLLWEAPTPDAVEHITVLDANNDGIPDVAAAITPSSRQIVLIDGLTHTTEWSSPIEVASNVHGIASGDLTGNGREDVIVNCSSTDRYVRALDGKDGLELWSFLTGGEVNHVLVSDVNLDGNLEVIAGSDDHFIYVLQGNNGAELFSYPIGDDVMNLGIGDISGDGLPNIAAITFGSNGLIYAFESLATAPSYLCGDADGSDAVDISDAVYLIAYIFGGGPVPDPLEAGDPDCSSAVDISDAVYLIAFIFGGGPAPCAACS